MGRCMWNGSSRRRRGHAVDRVRLHQLHARSIGIVDVQLTLAVDRRCALPAASCSGSSRRTPEGSPWLCRCRELPGKDGASRQAGRDRGVASRASSPRNHRHRALARAPSSAHSAIWRRARSRGIQGCRRKTSGRQRGRPPRDTHVPHLRGDARVGEKLALVQPCPAVVVVLDDLDDVTIGVGDEVVGIADLPLADLSGTFTPWRRDTSASPLRRR